VPDGRAVRPERLRGCVDVVVEQRVPLGVEVLGDPPLVRPREAVNDPLSDPVRAVQPEPVTRDVGGGQVGLDGVHVGIDPAVVLAGRERAVPGLDGHARLLVPEVLRRDGQRLVQELARSGPPRRGGARRGEDHEGVRVRGLVRLDRPVRVHRGEPAAVLGVAEHGPQRLDAVVRQGRRTRATHHRREREDVGHPAGDPQLGRPVDDDGALLVEPAEAAGR